MTDINELIEQLRAYQRALAEDQRPSSSSICKMIRESADALEQTQSRIEELETDHVHLMEMGQEYRQRIEELEQKLTQCEDKLKAQEALTAYWRSYVHKENNNGEEDPRTHPRSGQRE